MKYILKIAAGLFACLLLASCQTNVTQNPSADTTDAATDTETVTTAQTTDTTAIVAETDAPVLDGSFSTPVYTVTVTDGVCYLNFADGNDAETTEQGELAFGEDIQFLTFSSLIEMKETILEGSFTEQEMNVMKSHFLQSENGFIIWDIQKLWEPATPNGFQTNQVLWRGGNYSVSIVPQQDDTTVRGALDIHDTEQWEAAYASEMTIIQKNELTGRETEVFDGIPCETYIYTTST